MSIGKIELFSDAQESRTKPGLTLVRAEVVAEEDLVSEDIDQLFALEDGTDEPVEILKDTQLRESLSDYLKRINAIPLLKAEEEVELGREIQAYLGALSELERSNGELTSDERQRLDKVIERGLASRQRMIEANLRLVIGSAKKYRGRGVEFVDLIQEGNTGLIRAVEKFDPNMGYKFSTHALWWIWQSIGRAVNDKSRTIRLPNGVSEEVRILGKAEAYLADTLGRQPTAQEVADYLDKKASRVVALRVMRRNLAFKSLDAPVATSKDEFTFGDTVYEPVDYEAGYSAVEAPVHEADALNEFSRRMELLSPREKDALTMYYGLGREDKLDLASLAARFGIGEPATRALMDRAKAKLRHPSIGVLAVNLDNSQEWREDALCQQVGLQSFFPDKGESHRDARAVCQNCLARFACLDYALENNIHHGVWGGLSPRQRTEAKKEQG